MTRASRATRLAIATAVAVIAAGVAASLHVGRGAMLTLAVVLALGVAASSASAHVQVVSTSPAAGKTVSTAIKTVSATFTGRILGGKLTVSGPGGTTVSVGQGGRDPRKTTRLLVELKRSLKPGRYTARWAVTASDGHGQRGSFGFTLRKK